MMLEISKKMQEKRNAYLVSNIFTTAAIYIPDDKDSDNNLKY